MTTEENKKLVIRFIEEIINRQNLSAVEELIDPDFVVRGQGGRELRGIEGARAMSDMYAAAFPDFRVTADDLVAEDDRVMCRFTCTGTHKGEFMGIPPTGKSFQISGVSITKLVNGKQVETWGVSDYLGALQQLGAIPPI